MKRLAALLCAGLVLAAAPAFAASDDDAHGGASRSFAAPAQLSSAERDAYRAIFVALRARDWAGAAARLDEMRQGPLHDLARAQLYTLPGSPPRRGRTALAVARPRAGPAADARPRRSGQKPRRGDPALAPHRAASLRSPRPAAPRPFAPGSR